MILIGCLIFIALGVSMLFYSFLSVKKMILFSGIILTANGVVDIVFLIMLRTGMKKAEKLRIARDKEESEKSSGELAETSVVNTEEADYVEVEENIAPEPEKVQESVPESEEQNADADTGFEKAFQTAKVNLSKETVQTADAADAEAILEVKKDKTEENVESPGREIREMLKNHDEPLEEWKD